MTRVRLSIVGVVAIALFSALFARLWYLQVAGGTNIAAAANANRERILPLEPPRGRLLDDKGRVLADNKIVNAITVDRRLDAKTRGMVVGRLAELLGVPVAAIQKRLDDQRISPYTPVPVATDVKIDTVAYLSEHQSDFPGVKAESLVVRRYPNLSVMAQVLGYVGEINAEELKAHPRGGYQLGDEIGKAGAEATFEADLRGTPGFERLEIDSRGQVIRTLRTVKSLPGHDVQLTLDLDVQKLAEESLAQGMVSARAVQDTTVKDHYQKFAAPAGSLVVLDAQTGSVVAMASTPSYDPNEFVNGIPTDRYNQLVDPGNHFPLINRAIQGQYAPGSAFKLVTALAGLASGDISPGKTIDDTGCLDLKVAGGRFCNDGGAAYGGISLGRAITVSSDVYFYTIGRDLWQAFHRGDPSGNAIQDMARTLGFGKPTGVALPGESKGRVPDAAWKKAFNANNPDPSTRVWLPGDNIHFAVGQGDLLVTPIQLANAYQTFANGGTVFTLRIASAVYDASGEKLREIPPQPAGTVAFSPAWASVMMSGFEGTVARGTAAAAFTGFPLDTVSVAGKTGTAQVAGKEPTSVFVAMTPVAQTQYVLASIVEEAGYGAETAAPIVRRVLEGLDGLPLSTIQVQPPPTQAN